MALIEITCNEILYLFYFITIHFILGEIGGNVRFDCWKKHCPTLKDKDQSFTIKFKTDFTGPPKVIVGLDALDVNHHFNTRVTATANEVTAKQFRLNIKAWADTILYWANVHWIACGPIGPGCNG